MSKNKIYKILAEKIILKVKAIKIKNPNNLMARHFNESYFRNLDSFLQTRLIAIINTGIENPDSAMGAYAMNEDDYDLFKPMLEPMIRDYHGIPANKKIDTAHDWNFNNKECNLANINKSLAGASMRVRVARNVSSFPLPGAMTQKERVNFENLMVKAFKSLIDDKDFGGNYFSLTPGSSYKINSEKYKKLVNSHQMFKDMSGDKYLEAAGISADWPHGRGIYVSKNEDFLIWVGEEDHLRIVSMEDGGNLNALFTRLHEGIEKIKKEIPPFAESNNYGYVTSCPTNLGGGMRASLHMGLPKLTNNGKDLSVVKEKAKTLGLSVRGAGGEHSAAGKGGIVDISPSARLGITEMQVMQYLYDGVAALWKAEQGNSLSKPIIKPKLPKHNG